MTAEKAIVITRVFSFPSPSGVTLLVSGLAAERVWT